MKVITAFVLLLFSQLTYAAPKSELWPMWNTSNENNTTTVSHQSWQDLLDAYLIKQGENTLFQYASVTRDDKLKLKDYLYTLTQRDPRSFNKAEQYAYWVNLYNALTVNLILDNYPIKSITKLGGFFSFGPWGDKITKVAGQDLTLNDIEHRILRPIWQDPRTHYAVNCASLGCPNLQPEAFTSANTPILLEQAATEFINSNKGALSQSNSVQLSSIFDWFSDDFGSQADLFKHLKRYKPELALDNKKIKFDYNWDLNEAK